MQLLIDKYKKEWEASISHQLTDRLCTGELSLFTLYVYLQQDFKFFDEFVKLLAKAISVNRDAKINVVLGKQLGFICADENNYFVDVLVELVRQNESRLASEQDIGKFDATKTLPSVQAYNDFMAALTRDPHITYEELITVLYVMEQVYLEWANKGLLVKPADLAWWYDDWIKLHSGPDFEKWCALLRSEVSRYYESGSQDTRHKMDEIFVKTVNFETAFFDDCYDYKL